MSPAKFLVFDLDGTLSDPAVGIAKSINYALSHCGYPCIDEADVSRYIGPPLDVSFGQITGCTDSAHVAELVAKYRERYADVGYAENTLYPGIPQALDALAERQVPMGICTSKRSDFAERILTMFGLHHHFQFVSGGDIGIQKWQQLAGLIQQQKMAPGSTMIGDRAVDICAAKTNGMRSVGVLWGHGMHAELSAEHPDTILSATAQLAKLSTHC